MKQKLRRIHPEIRSIVIVEVNKLLAVGFILKVQYPEWLENVVVVPKKNGKWRVCVDYSDLNEACLKDIFLLPRIDQIMDTTTGIELLSFMDAYSRYNQIPMFLLDLVKTTFITTEGMFHYKVMPF